MPQLRLYLLGASRVELHTEPAPLAARKGLALLAYLALTQQVQQRNALATLLWPELGQQSARAALRRELHTITAAIGEGFLVATRNEVAFAPDADLWVDVEAFRQSIDAYSGHTPAEDALMAATALYRGDFLAELALEECLEFEEWRTFQADGLRQMFARATQALVQANAHRGEYQTALGYARRWLETEPLHEPAHRELMRLYALSGQQNAALRQYEECVRIFKDELDVAPEAETTALHESIRTRRFPTPEQVVATPAAPARQRHNLPTQTTSFIGRQDELAAICELLLENEACRLLTLLGPGGIGKTRLSLQVAQHLVDESEASFPDGIYFVPLASLADQSDLVRAIASAAGYTFVGVEEPQTQLEKFLRTQRLLLVVDNFEHLLDGAKILSRLLTVAPKLSILVTSRETLELAEEWLYPLGGLPAPADNETLEQQAANSAVQLFVQRARRVDASFTFTAENAASVVRVCQLVDGMPLGLELAAGWVQMLSVDEIASEIASNLDILASELRNIPERHRSLRVIFEQTWSRLRPVEQQTLRRLAIFRGTFTREAAQQVTGTSLLEISSLVDKILCRHRAGRYDIHELLRQFAIERMEENEAETMQAQHSRYFGTLLQSQQQSVMTAGEDAMLQIITDDFDNILAAWRYLTEQLRNESNIEEDATQMGKYIPALAVYFDRRALFWEGQRIFQGAIDVVQDAASQGQSQTAPVRGLFDILRIEYAGIRMHLGHYQEVQEYLLDRLPHFRTQAHPHHLAAALNYLGPAHTRVGAYGEAERCLEEAIALYEQLDLPLESTTPLINMGLTKTRSGKYAAARAYYQKAVEIYEKVHYATGLARCLSNIGSTYPGEGQVHQAIAYYEKAYAIVRESTNRLWIAIILSNLGDCARVLGNNREAQDKFAQGLAIFRDLREMRWVTVTLADSSFPLIALGELDRAARNLIESLQLAQEYQLIGDGLQALSATASLFQCQNEHEWAVAVATHVLADTRAHSAAQKNCTKVLRDLTEILSPTIYAAAQFRGESTPFLLMIQDVARALEQNGSS